jgi:hypothetical protein
MYIVEDLYKPGKKKVLHWKAGGDGRGEERKIGYELEIKRKREF